jgi:hypothetical protein
MARRRPKRSQGDLEAEVLKGRWAGLRANEALHMPEANQRDRRRCRALIEGGADAVSWDDLLSER